MKNRELAALFQKMADILECRNDNPFKINAYRKAARIVNDLTDDLEKLVQAGTLQDIPGIGKGTAEKITRVPANGHDCHIRADQKRHR